ncbi:hypothetical protein ACHAWF_009840 [Thalassiosira exigua]
MGQALLDVLPRLLPVSTEDSVSAALDAVRRETRNGYDLLWRVMALSVPGFNRSVSVGVPTLTIGASITDFARIFQLYFRLEAKRGQHHSDRVRSSLFLSTVSLSGQLEYADAITTLQTHINNYDTLTVDDSVSEDFLPVHLRLDGLAATLVANAAARAQDAVGSAAVGLGSRVNHLSTSARGPRVDVDDADAYASDDGDPRDFRALRADADRSGRPRFTSDRGNRGPPRDRRFRGRSPLPRDGRTDGRTRSRSDGGSRPRSNRGVSFGNRRPRMSIGASNLMTLRQRDEIEAKFIASRPPRRDGRPSARPRQVLRTFMTAQQLSEEDVDACIAWDSWPLDDDSALVEIAHIPGASATPLASQPPPKGLPPPLDGRAPPIPSPGDVSPPLAGWDPSANQQSTRSAVRRTSVPPTPRPTGKVNDIDSSGSPNMVPPDLRYPDSPPLGSMFDPDKVDRPISPDLVCDFPMDLRADAELDSILAELPSMPSLMDSVVHVVDRPRVLGLGLGRDRCSFARLRVSATALVAPLAKGIIDGGSNICLTNTLALLLDVVDISPVPVSVAIEDDSPATFLCTAKGSLPLRMDNGTIHYQPTFYCADAVETIISPQAILNSRDDFVSWTQCGYKDGRPGTLRFDSHDGLLTMSFKLDCIDGLYYCPTDAFTVDSTSPALPPVPALALTTVLPLRLTEAPMTLHPPVAAAAARMKASRVSLFDRDVPKPTRDSAALILSEFNIGQDVTEQIYVSPHAYDDAFDEVTDLRKFDLSKHRTAGMSFVTQNQRLLLATMSPSTPGAKIPRWRLRLRGAWLRRIEDIEVSSIADAQQAFAQVVASGKTTVLLTFSHLEVRHGLSRTGLPILSREEFTQLSVDQFNNRWGLPEDCDLVNRRARYNVVDSGNVLNYVTCAMRLTRGRLQRQSDWEDWQSSEWLQLDQYDKQGMFGDPVAVESKAAFFNLVWSYAVKVADGRKKARMTCDGSTRAGQVRVLDYTYANCVDQTSSRLFYAISAAENLLIYGSDVSNAFGEAPPPKQGFFIRPDKAFHDWFTARRTSNASAKKHLATWMRGVPIAADRPLPMKTEPHYLRRLYETVGSKDPKEQAALAKENGFSFRSGIGELIYPMSTCRPDLSFASIKLSQSSSCPHREHYKAVRHALKYMYATREYGNVQDLLPLGRADHDPLHAHGFADSDWATCPRTRRSFGGACARLRCGTVGYKSRFQATVANSSTEAEFMAACDLGRMMLYIRSVLWDLDVPQEAATLLYEDNDACTALGNAQKPTTRTRHMDIKYFVLCEWIERDMLKLERVDTKLNLSDHFTKALPRSLFHRHVDYILGNVPPAYAPSHNRAIGKFVQTTPPLANHREGCTTRSRFEPRHNPVAATAAHVRGSLGGSHHDLWNRIVWSGLR